MLGKYYQIQSLLAAFLLVLAFTPTLAYPQSSCVDSETAALLPDMVVLDSEKLEWKKIKWSVPVIVRDSFTEKQSVVVFDRDYQKGNWGAEKGIYSIWAQTGIKAKFYIRNGSDIVTSDVMTLSIKINGDIFDLKKVDNSLFLLTPELLNALNTPQVPKVLMRITFADSDTQTISIGEKTIKSWQSIKLAQDKLSNTNNICKK